MHFLFVGLLKHVDAIEGIDVACELCPYVPVDEISLVDIGTIAFFWVFIVVAGHSRLESLYPLTNGCTLVGCQELVLWVLDVVHYAIAG